MTTTEMKRASGYSPRHALVPVALESEEELAFAQRAIAAAAAAVAPCGEGRVTIVTVRVPVDGVSSSFAMSDTMFDAYRSILNGREAWANQQIDKLVEDGRALGVRVEGRTLIDKKGIAEEIIDGAAAVKADLIVMSTHSRRGVTRLFLGSVAQRVAHLSSIPLLLLLAPITKE
jgi:nucleotide-binding universal stress UspA family protein